MDKATDIATIIVACIRVIYSTAKLHLRLAEARCVSLMHRDRWLILTENWLGFYRWAKSDLALSSNLDIGRLLLLLAARRVIVEGEDLERIRSLESVVGDWVALFVEVLAQVTAFSTFSCLILLIIHYRSNLDLSIDILAHSIIYLRSLVRRSWLRIDRILTQLIHINLLCQWCFQVLATLLVRFIAILSESVQEWVRFILERAILYRVALLLHLFGVRGALVATCNSLVTNTFNLGKANPCMHLLVRWWII